MNNTGNLTQPKPKMVTLSVTIAVEVADRPDAIFEAYRDIVRVVRLGTVETRQELKQTQRPRMVEQVTEWCEKEEAHIEQELKQTQRPRMVEQ